MVNDALRRRLLSVEQPVRSGRLGRLLASGRAAAGIGAASLGARLRGERGGLASGDLEAITRLVERLGELKGVAMKAGQILATIDPTLSEELRGALAVLQTAAPASRWDEVAATVREAFGSRAEELLAGMDPAPLASASIGQVHRARLGSADVAVKVRHPAIVQALEADFATASIGPLVAGGLGLADRANVRSFLDEARAAMLEECDYAVEADRQERFGAWFADHEIIRIPAVVRPWCAGTVLTTAFRPGLPVDAVPRLSPALRDRIGVALFELYVATLYRHGAFHADPHPGNYAVTEHGEVVVYDFGCVRSFAPERVRALAMLVVAVREDDVRAIVEATTALGAPPPGPAAIPNLRALLRGFFAPLLVPGARAIAPGEGFDARTVLRDKRALAQLRLPGSLLFLFRIRFGLYAVLARLGAVADWSALERRWADEAFHGPVPADAGAAAAPV